MLFESFDDKLGKQRIALESADRARELGQEITEALDQALAQIKADIASCLERVFSTKPGQEAAIKLINKYRDIAEMFIRGLTKDVDLFPKNTTEYTEDDWHPISLKLKDVRIKDELSNLYLKRDVVNDMRDSAVRKDFTAVAALFVQNKKLVQQGTDWWRVMLDRITKLLNSLCSSKKIHQPVLYTQLADSNTLLFGAYARKNTFDKLNSSVSAYQSVIA